MGYQGFSADIFFYKTLNNFGGIIGQFSVLNGGMGVYDFMICTIQN